MKLKFMVASTTIVALMCAQSTYASDTINREEAIKRTLAVSPVLAASQARIEAFGASIEQANVRPNPTLSLATEDFTGTGPFTGLNQSEITFSYAQKFERGGKRQLRTSLARMEQNAVKLEFDINKLDIIKATETAYLDVLLALAQLKAIQEQINLFQELKSAISDRVEQGRDSQLALQNAELRLLQIQTQKNAAEQKLSNLKFALARLWQSSDTDFEIDAKQLHQLPDALLPAKLEILQTSPDIQIWVYREQAKKGALDLEKAQAKQDPTVSFGVRYLQTTGDVAAVANVSIPFALYDTNKGNIKRAKAEISQNRYQLIEVERKIENALFNEQRSLETSFVQIQRLKKGLKQAQEAKSTALEQLSLGLVSYLDIFASQALVFDFETQIIQQLSAFHTAQIEIDRLTARYSTFEVPASALAKDEGK
ncbi:TolC family protein [Kordiimonas sp. SCSIO 12603]|uniref:TolC family protein n=1 Tax=Kordiimonas sp. SCSIO 12603 TaxID=2829596 RepID=UPI0021025D9A|nr:TolC family protein [Kordiimonas sp. SCSIO 12603]UTW58761.1 TolC family protein [Kordiimonas sp. SCSIO 12603]